MGDNEQWPLKWDTLQPGHTQCRCPQPLLPTLCLASGKGGIVNLSPSILRKVRVILHPSACSTPIPPHSQALPLKWKSLWRSPLGMIRTSPCPQEETRWAALLERVTPVPCPLAVPKHRLWWSHTHSWGQSEGIKEYALKRIVYTDCKPQNLME